MTPNEQWLADATEAALASMSEGDPGFDQKSDERRAVAMRIPVSLWLLVRLLKARDARDDAPETNGEGRSADDRIANLQREVSLLRSRCKELENRPTLEYRGVWDSGTTYQAGNVVTCKGSMWHCQEATRSQPGEAGAASRAWVLAVKRGADGKGAR
jgi:hypothetical protein